MWVILLILSISVPLFYIIGLIAFIKWLVGITAKNRIERKQYLKNTIEELSKVVASSPQKKLIQQLNEYKNELDTIIKKEQIILPTPTQSISQLSSSIASGDLFITGETPVIIEEKEVEIKPKTSPRKDWENLISNWYSDNSINLLLYLGAFLIVASASIYVGFAWETIGGVSKAALLSLLTLAFFGFGTWFYNVPKIKQAGATFIAIAALLIPFNGLAWYNFVLEPAGYSIGGVWLATSIIAVLTYSFLAYFIRHPFYTYIAGFGSLSMVLSLVNTAELNREFYVLGGIFSSFVLLLSTKLFTKSSDVGLKNYIAPLTVSAHIIMPISLVFGLLLAAASDTLFTFEVVASAFLASLYYATAYDFAKEAGYLYASLLIFPVFSFLFGKWIGIPTLQIFIIIQVISTAYLTASHFFKSRTSKEPEVFLLTAHILMPASIALIFITVAYPTNFYVIEVVIGSILATLFYFGAYLSSKQIGLLIVSQLALAVSVFLTGKWLSLEGIQIITLLELLCFVYILIAYFVSNL